MCLLAILIKLRKVTAYAMDDLGSFKEGLVSLKDSKQNLMVYGASSLKSIFC